MEKKVENSRQKILNISQDLFVKKGYLSISMREIAEACGLSKPGLYYYFTNKEELFLAILDSQLDALSTLIGSIRLQSGTSREMIRTFIQEILTDSTQQAGLIRLGTREMSNLDEKHRKEFFLRYQDKFLSPLAAILKTGMAAGEIRSIDPDLGIWALLGLVYPYLNRSDSSESEIQEVTSFLESVFFDGIAAK